MTYVVTEKCVKCKFTDCVEVCPVDAFREGENFLVIDPQICIDCSLCEPVCPAQAIVSENSDDPMIDQYIAFAEKVSDESSDNVWPIILEAKDPLPNAEQEIDRAGKWAEVSEQPGEGS